MLSHKDIFAVLENSPRGKTFAADFTHFQKSGDPTIPHSPALRIFRFRCDRRAHQRWSLGRCFPETKWNPRRSRNRSSCNRLMSLGFGDPKVELAAIAHTLQIRSIGLPWTSTMDTVVATLSPSSMMTGPRIQQPGKMVRHGIQMKLSASI